LFAKLPEDGKPVDFGKHDVEDDDIVLAGSGMPEGGLAVGSFIDGIAGFAKALNEGFAKGLKILDDQQAHLVPQLARACIHDTGWAAKAKPAVLCTAAD
jgi:hypothetical protein